MKLGIISLGCAKNKVDSELFLGVSKKYDLEITNDLKDADIIVINTCGFIESAKKEAIDTILEIVDYKQHANKKITIIAIGCLVERYLNDLKESIPEVDIYFPIKDYEHIDDLFKQLTKKHTSYLFDYENRVLSTTASCAYIRIAEGCNNKCSYCSIPLIRGSFVSRPFDDIIEEAKTLEKQGIKEITLIAQDTTRYGTDFKEDKRRLHDLLREISKLNGIKWIRVLYLYPDEVTSKLLEEFRTNDKVIKYFDIPIQHCNNRLLKLMNRRGSKDLIKEHIKKIREYVPNVIVRTTLIVGFPTETNEEFKELKEFVKEMKFERLGCFTYSREEDTTSFDMKPQIKQSKAINRLNEIMESQVEISREFNNKLLSTTTTCIIEGYDFERLCYYGRNYMYAPDDVDGKIYIYSDKELIIGDFVDVEIISTDVYDLFAKVK